MAATNTLPPLPPSLKSISPFMLRAEELRKSDPVMSYWCTPISDIYVLLVSLKQILLRVMQVHTTPHRPAWTSKLMKPVLENIY
jgi:hypothetical protein